MREKKTRVKELVNYISTVIKCSQNDFKDPCVSEILEALWDSERDVNMLHRVVSFIFNSSGTNKEAFLRMIEISLKRWRKKNSDCDFVTSPPLGIIGIMVIVPIIQRMVSNSISEEKASEEINTATMEIMKTISENISSKEKN